MKTLIEMKKASANDNDARGAKSKKPRAFRANRVGPRPSPTRARSWAPAILATFFSIGCNTNFDPPSEIEGTRVVGARVEVMGAPERASPAPGETATVTWFVTAPAATPPLQWAFALCLPAPLGALGCDGVPLATFTGADSPPRTTFTVPSAASLGTNTHLVLYGRICSNAAPTFDPEIGIPSCAGGGEGTTTSLSILVEPAASADANHNPTADHGFTFDGQPWPALASGADPCVTSPKIPAGSDAHQIGLSAVGTDRERYTAMFGDPPVPTPERESLQFSLFSTSGKLKSPFIFVEAADPSATTALAMKWTAPKLGEVTAPKPITFTFVLRDDRGGTDWTTRAACVTP
ncbi:MAG TPA: hypothetical protein VHJ20_24220 [Polyangia bacterium]|nr:hypothetical protein [Polyangia bacterium]